MINKNPLLIPGMPGGLFTSDDSDIDSDSDSDIDPFDYGKYENDKSRQSNHKE